jgi:hypothetical protein
MYACVHVCCCGYAGGVGGGASAGKNHQFYLLIIDRSFQELKSWRVIVMPSLWNSQCNGMAIPI